VYSVHATTFDLTLMAVFGVVGYLLRKQGVPMAPLILGFVLGEMMEQNLRRALSITNGELGILLESPISMGLWLMRRADGGGAAAAAPAPSAPGGAGGLKRCESAQRARPGRPPAGELADDQGLERRQVAGARQHGAAQQARQGRPSVYRPTMALVPRYSGQAWRRWARA
jgi:hypothetical protein